MTFIHVKKRKKKKEAFYSLKATSIGKSKKLEEEQNKKQH
jgi:hypothetical protein